MSTQGITQYNIKAGNLTDEMLITILKKELPDALERMGISKPLSWEAVGDLAYYLADYAKACDRAALDKIQETKTLQLVRKPTPEQCKDLQELLEQIVRIHIVSKDYKANKHIVKNSVGKIWSIIMDEEREKRIFEREMMNTPNAADAGRG